PQEALGDQPGGRWSDDDAGMSGTGASRPIATATDDPAMSPDLDLQDGRVLGAREVREGLATPRTTGVFGEEFVILDDGRELGIIASPGTGPTALLTARPPRQWRGGGRRRDRRCGRRGRFGLSAEELLLAEAQQRLKPVDLGLELG